MDDFCFSHRWLDGQGELDSTGQPKDYFTCAEYLLLDGYKIAKFPRGMSLYHGSFAFGNTNSEYPIGKNFYRPVSERESRERILPEQASQDSESVVSILASNSGVSPSWYTDRQTSSLYLNDMRKICVNCRFRYVTKDDIYMLLINDDDNIIQFFNLALIQEDYEILDVILEMNGYLDENFKPDYGKFRDDIATGTLSHKNRFSKAEPDSQFAIWICENVIGPNNFSGYASPDVFSSYHGGLFHLEFIFCDATLHLERILDTPEPESPNVKLFVAEMKKYVTTNVNFHAGNLYQHSCWIVLYTEYLADIVHIPDEYVRFMSIAAFFHDVGKMTFSWPSYSNEYRQEIDYYTVPDHSEIGRNYILGLSHLHRMDSDGQKSSETIPVSRVIEEMISEGIGSEGEGSSELIDQDIDFWRSYCSFITAIHWTLGDNLYRKVSAPRLWKLESLLRSGEVIPDDYEYEMGLISRYIDYLDREISRANFHVPIDTKLRKFFIHSALIISTADIMASQPFNAINNVKIVPGQISHYEREIRRSRFFDFIEDVPKIYPGGNLAVEGKFGPLYNIVDLQIDSLD